MAKGKIKTLHNDLIGTVVPEDHGLAGVFVENELRQQGLPLQKGKGPDLLEYGLEVKTRDKDSVSPHTIGNMKRTDIIAKPYAESVIKEKMQQQFRVITKDQVVVKNNVVDFSSNIIQEKLSEAYETARKLLAKGCTDMYVPGTYWGYFEKRSNSDSYYFRISHHAMKKLVGMSTSTYNNIIMEKQ